MNLFGSTHFTAALSKTQFDMVYYLMATNELAKQDWREAILAQLQQHSLVMPSDSPLFSTPNRVRVRSMVCLLSS
jgi:hypothetical protein